MRAIWPKMVARLGMTGWSNCCACGCMQEWQRMCLRSGHQLRQSKTASATMKAGVHTCLTVTQGALLDASACHWAMQK